jgi:hypothetical protein
LDTDWSYTLFFAFSAALAASFNKMFLLKPKKPGFSRTARYVKE